MIFNRAPVVSNNIHSTFCILQAMKPDLLSPADNSLPVILRFPVGTPLCQCLRCSLVEEDWRGLVVNLIVITIIVLSFSCVVFVSFVFEII